MQSSLRPMRLGLAQINSHVGDISGNGKLIREFIARAREEDAEIVLFPELAVTGYPPEDLLLKEHFLRAAYSEIRSIAAKSDGLVVLVGFPERSDDVYNSMAVLAKGEIQAIYRKISLPNYGVFDERRYFQSGEGGVILDLDKARIGLTICEDIWSPGGPGADEARAGASLIVNLSASPYQVGKGTQRERMLIQRARDNLCAVAYCNLVGGQDELIFDGHSMVIDHQGNILARAPQFTESLLMANVDMQAAVTARLRDTRLRRPIRTALPQIRQLGSIEHEVPKKQIHELGGDVAEMLDIDAEIYAALRLGVRDYVDKNGFNHVVLGLSGGVDSALVAVIAVDALGKDRVTCVVMPSPYSSEETQADAHTLADNLGVQCINIALQPLMETYNTTLFDVFKDHEPDITEENLQARIRGNILMALSNKFGWLVLTTGNKSEISVGYTTIYGDSAGGFSVLKDVPKTKVYRLIKWRNNQGDHELVPEAIITRPPSAELRVGQKDSDSLPDYETLDAILQAYIEEDAGREHLELMGLPPDAINKVLSLVDRNEYKRRQAPPGIKITPRAFGRDRRMPITNGFRD